MLDTEILHALLKAMPRVGDRVQRLQTLFSIDDEGAFHRACEIIRAKLDRRFRGINDGLGAWRVEA